MTHHRFSEVIVWQAPERGVDLVTSYRVQWRSFDEDYTTAKHQAVAALNDPEDLDGTDVGFMIPTAAHDMHAVRVTAVTNDSAEQSAEALSPFSPQVLEQTIAKKIVAPYRSQHPWLAETWAYMQARPGFFRTFDRVLLNNAGVSIRIDYDSEPLYTTAASFMKIRTDLVGEDHLYVYVHEMAHIYTLVTEVALAPEAVAVAHLYFQHMIDNSDTQEPRYCYASEFYADTVDAAIPTTSRSLIRTYWERDSECTAGVTEPPEQAIQVVLSALRGQTPQWLHDVYGTSDGGLDLESLWATLRNISKDLDRAAVLYHLKDSFGGYCNPRHVQSSALGSRPVRNPWRDGGCVPRPP